MITATPVDIACFNNAKEAPARTWRNPEIFANSTRLRRLIVQISKPYLAVPANTEAPYGRHADVVQIHEKVPSAWQGIP